MQACMNAGDRSGLTAHVGFVLHDRCLRDDTPLGVVDVVVCPVVIR